MPPKTERIGHGQPYIATWPARSSATWPVEAREPEDPETFLQVARNVRGFEGDGCVSLLGLRDCPSQTDRLAQVTGAPYDNHAGTYEIEPSGGDVETEALNHLVTSELRTAFEKLSEIQSEVLALASSVV